MLIGCNVKIVFNWVRAGLLNDWVGRDDESSQNQTASGLSRSFLLETKEPVKKDDHSTI